MGWRSTGAAFRAGNYSGPLTSDQGGFASGFAATFNAGISKAADIITTDIAAERQQERELEQIRLRETLANQRASATRSRSANNTTVQQFEEAQAFSEEYGVSVEEAIRILAASDWDSSQAGTALTNERAAGTGAVTGLVLDEPATTEEPATPAVEETSSAVPSVSVPSVAETAQADDLLATEPVPAQEEEGFIQIASRGDTVTDIPIPLITSTDTEQPLIERAEEVVAEVASSDTPVGSQPITYEDRVAAGETPAAAAATVVRGAERVPEMFALPSLTDITTLESALAVRDVLEGRRQYLGGIDDYYRTYMPVLEQRIQSLGEGGLPDLGELLQENKRDELVEYINGGWERFRGIVDEETLLAHVRRAEELEGSAMSMPSIPSSLDDLRAMNSRVQAGEFGNPTYVPREWRETLNSALAEAEFNDRYGSRLTPDYIFDDARTERELTGLLRSAEGSLRSDHPVVRDLQTALGIRNEMPDEINIFDGLTKDNWEVKEAEALSRGDEEGAATIRDLGMRMNQGNPDVAEVYDNISGIMARANAPVQEARANLAAYLGAADSAYRMTEIVARRPNILTLTGGALPSAINRIENEIRGFSNLFGSPGEETGVTQAQFEAEISRIEEQANTLFTNREIDEAARDYALYKAQEARLAYMIVRSQQGSGGVISNQDYNSALEQVRASTSAGTYEDSLRSLIAADGVRVAASLQQVKDNDQIRLAQQTLAASGVEFPLVQDMFRSIEENAELYGAGDAYNWLQGNVTLVEGEVPTTPADSTSDQAGESGSMTNPITLPSDATPATVGEYVGPGQYYLTPDGRLMRMPTE